MSNSSATPWTIAFQVPLSRGFPRQEYFILQRFFPAQGLNPHLLHWQEDSLPLNHQGIHLNIFLALWNEFTKILYVKQINLPSKVEKSCVTLFPELLVLLTLCASHSFHHFLIQLHWRRKRLWVPTQNISKVYVEEFAWMLIRNSFVSRITCISQLVKQCLFIKDISSWWNPLKWYCNSILRSSLQSIL